MIDFCWCFSAAAAAAAAAAVLVGPWWGSLNLLYSALRCSALLFLLLLTFCFWRIYMLLLLLAKADVDQQCLLKTTLDRETRKALETALLCSTHHTSQHLVLPSVVTDDPEVRMTTSD